jgi:hypothetical protein
MQYVPAIIVALGVAACVMVGLYLTHNPYCLFGLLGELVAYICLPGKSFDDFF